jgi:hypothetical protein
MDTTYQFKISQKLKVILTPDFGDDDHHASGKSPYS